ncbi:hypothetical protein [Cryobacterium sp. N21]|uniref:hypothetical protein n=1 Tax=Cryobacterium sp. N21 TaxID=2048289 RepID=UPI001124DF3C|nr:hypothetical protein [Cryobacterium sp. N21]
MSSGLTTMFQVTGANVSATLFEAVELEGEFDGRTVCSAGRLPRMKAVMTAKIPDPLLSFEIFT